MPNQSNAKNLNFSGDELLDDFVTTLISFKKLLAQYNINIQATSEKSLELYRTLPLAQQQGIYQGTKTYTQMIFEATQNNVDLKNNLELTRFALEKLEMHSPESFLDKLQREDLVEIYNLEHIQVFRNLRFFEVTSYSLSDLVIYDWPQLYYRSSHVTDEILQRIGLALQSEGPIPIQVEPHHMKEILCDDGQMNYINFKYISPLFTDESKKTVVGYIDSCTAEIVSNKHTGSEKVAFI